MTDSSEGRDEKEGVHHTNINLDAYFRACRYLASACSILVRYRYMDAPMICIDTLALRVRLCLTFIIEHSEVFTVLFMTVWSSWYLGWDWYYCLENQLRAP